MNELSPGNGYFAYEKAFILGKWDFLQFAWKQASKLKLSNLQLYL